MPAGLAITPEDVARSVADTIDSPPALRRPVGALAKDLLEWLDRAPSDEPFDTIAAMTDATAAHPLS